jgi:hypothetical protein
MLRSVKHPHIGGTLKAFKATSAATPTIDVGAGDAPTVSVSSTSSLTITLAEYPIRRGIVLCQPAANIADGGWGMYLTDPDDMDPGQFQVRTVNASASADAGTSFILALDYTNEYTDRISPAHALKNTARSPRMMGFRISSAGAVTIGGTQGTCSVASSVYTITFTNAFSRDVMAWATPINTSQHATRITAVSATSVEVSMFDSSEAAADCAFDLLVLGWDSKDEQYGMGRAIQVPQLKPRIEVIRIDGTGTANLSCGDTDATLTDNGTGDFTLTWTQPFARAPLVFVTGLDDRAQLKSAPTSTAATIVTFDTDGVASDAEVSVLVLGFDSADEK